MAIDLKNVEAAGLLLGSGAVISLRDEIGVSVLALLRRIPELIDESPAMVDVLQEIDLGCMVTMHSATQTLDTLLVMASSICRNITLIQQIFDKRPWDLAPFIACGNCNMLPLRWAAHQAI